MTEESNQYTREYLRNLQTFHDDTESDGFCISEFSQQWVPCKDLVNTMNPWNLSSEDRFRSVHTHWRHTFSSTGGGAPAQFSPMPIQLKSVAMGVIDGRKWAKLFYFLITG